MDRMEKKINKDLILREKLALERTDMAIDRTLLSFIRTALYFAVAGLSVQNLLQLNNGLWVEILFFVLSFVVLLIGIFRFLRQKRRLKENEKHIGDYKLEWEEDID